MNIQSTILHIFTITALAILLLHDVTVTQGTNVSRGWTRLGNEIYGTTSGESLGRYMDMSGDGTTIVASTDQVSTRVYKYNSVSRLWRQIGSDMLGEGIVAISNDGTTIAIADSLSAIVYKYNGNDWIIVGGDYLPSEQEGINDVALSADGTKVIVGYPTIVKVYQFNTAASRWVQLGPAIQGTVSCRNYLFRSVDISSNGLTIAVNGVKNCNDLGRNLLGQVSVYRYVAAQSRWIQLGSSIDGEPTENTPTGKSISISGDGTIIAFGSPDQGSVDIGYKNAVRIYQFQPSSSRWIQMGSDIIGEPRSDGFGFHVALSLDGTTVAIGASSNKGFGIQYSGRTLVYKFSRTTSRWMKLGLNINGLTEYGFSGSAVALSSNGTTLAVGAPGGYDIEYGTGLINTYRYNTVVTSRCDVAWRLYNSQPERLIGPIYNGTIFTTNAPPCTTTNIEAIILPTLSSCILTPNTTVLMKLYSQDMSRLLVTRNETARYFLFGTSRIIDVNNGRIASGTYNLQVNVNGWNSPLTRFTLRSTGSC